MQSKCRCRSASSASAPVRTAVVSMSPSPISPTTLAHCASSSSTTSRLLTRRSTKAWSWAKAVSSARLGDGLLQVGQRPLPQAALAAADGRDDVDRDVPGLGSMLEPVEHGPPVHPREADIQDDRVGLVLAGQGQPRLAVEGDDSLEPLLVRQVEQEAGELGVIVDDQEDPVAGAASAGAVVADIGRRRPRGDVDSGPRARRDGRQRPSPWGPSPAAAGRAAAGRA